jgi:uncharacterized protein (DUF58 family)
MDTDRFFSRYARDETLIRRRPWYVLALALLLLSALTHQSVVFLAALFALVCGLVPEIWYRHALHQLVLRQEVNLRQAFFGETITLSISVENRKVLPLPWLEVEDELPAQVMLLTGRASPTYKVNRVALVNAFSLWSFQRVTRRYQLRCTARGVYTFGPTMLRSGDPFGWLVHEEQAAAKATLLVYPLVAPLEAFGLPARHPLGDEVTPRRLLEDPLRIAGVREYQIGDDPRRIHWKATARAGALRSKIYEPSSQHRLLILLEVTTYKESWMGIDPEMQELTIAAAASLALWGLDAGYSVGLLANSLLIPLPGENSSSDGPPPTGASTHAGVPRVHVPFAHERGQRQRVLSALGRLLPYLGLPLETLIDEARMRLPAGSTVVLVSAAGVLREPIIERLLDLRAQGASIHLVLTGDAETAPGAVTYDIPMHRAGGREVWHELVRSAAEQADGDRGRSATSLHLD